MNCQKCSKNSYIQPELSSPAPSIIMGGTLSTPRQMSVCHASGGGRGVLYSKVIPYIVFGPLFIFKGVAESEAHCINADANHTLSKFSQLFFRQIFFILMLTKKYIFVFKNFLLLHKLKK